jgi:hypothetical protein
MLGIYSWLARLTGLRTKHIGVEKGLNYGEASPRHPVAYQRLIADVPERGNIIWVKPQQKIPMVESHLWDEPHLPDEY